MSVVSGLVVQAAAFMGRAGYSPGSRVHYQRIWDQFGEYCDASGVRQPDRETAARFCVAVGADGAEQWQVFYRRAVGCLFDVAEMGRFALRAVARADLGARDLHGGVRGVRGVGDRTRAG